MAMRYGKPFSLLIRTADICNSVIDICNAITDIYNSIIDIFSIIDIYHSIKISSNNYRYLQTFEDICNYLQISVIKLGIAAIPD
jgi:hypothetical protein